MMSQRKERKILNMKLGWLLIWIAALYLYSVTAETVGCEEGEKNYSSVPSVLNKNISTLCLTNNNITLNEKDVVILQTYINLTKLYLNNNTIVILRNYSFNSLSNLEILDVSNNAIRTAEQAAFAGLNKLTTLNLQNNKIRQLDSNAFVLLKSLTVLNLQNNYLEYFVIKVSLNLITLSGNPWNCSCSLLNLQSWLNNTKVTLENENDTTCRSPENMKKQPIKNALIHNCEKKEKTEVTTIPSASINLSNNTIISNDTHAKSLNADFQPPGKSWSFLLGVLVVVTGTTLVIVMAIKFPAWYRYLISYNHSRLEEEEPEMFEETFTPQTHTVQQTQDTNEEESIMEFEQFHTFFPEEDGFIEDKYIDT